jgi:AhpD family alkylhydroperoxidase
MSKRLNIKNLAPEVYQNLTQLSQFVANAGIDPLQQELIKIRASQLNGCAYCMDIHTREALKLGEDPRRLAVLSAWRDVEDWFSEEDKVILKLTEELTIVVNHGLSEETYEQAVDCFGEMMTAKLIIAVININSWNRLGISQRLHPIS